MLAEASFLLTVTMKQQTRVVFVRIGDLQRNLKLTCNKLAIYGKVSVYLHEGVESYTERFVPRWKEANCAVAGPYWIDTTFANKGIGVQCVCRTLGIDPAQVMAFGDNYNDETMLDVVGVPYIMDNAAAPLRAKYKNHTPRPEDVLAQLLAQQP